MHIRRRSATVIRLLREGRLLDTIKRKLYNRLQADYAPRPQTPIEKVADHVIFATDTGGIRDAEKAQIRQQGMMIQSTNIEETYPHVFEAGDHFLRYSYIPASRTSRGLVVLFHGWNAFHHIAPSTALADFDLLAPWDTFGHRRQGSWFWGEKGDGFVAPIIQALIEQHRDGKDWFATGTSMGGFGALYHGFTSSARGLYVMAPQIDLRQKILDYGIDHTGNPYRFLMQDTLDDVPDLLALATAQDTLPPLFLIQNQYDPVNYFADHAFKLIEIYNQKQAWYSLRVHPAIGHAGYVGTMDEAVAFFNLILDKNPPHKTEFRSSTITSQ